MVNSIVGSVYTTPMPEFTFRGTLRVRCPKAVELAAAAERAAQAQSQ